MGAPAKARAAACLPHQICDLVHGGCRLTRLAGLRLLRLWQQEWGAGWRVLLGKHASRRQLAAAAAAVAVAALGESGWAIGSLESITSLFSSFSAAIAVWGGLQARVCASAAGWVALAAAVRADRILHCAI